MKNVAVFFGGQSVEHDISILTGVMTANSVDKERYNSVPIYIDKEGNWFTGGKLFDPDGYKSLDKKKLTKCFIMGGDNTLYMVKGKKIKPLLNIAVAINCMHGERGEDGSLAGLLNLSKIPLASPQVLPSSACIDKRFTKIVMKGLSVNVLPSVYVEKESQINEIIDRLEYPVIVKPNRLGSSIGITVASDEKSLRKAFMLAKKYGEGAIIEKKLEGFIEINCAAYLSLEGIVVSECEKPIGKSDLLSFEDKYSGGKREFPADISKKLSDKIKKLTVKIYKELGCDGVIRIDYFIKDNKVFVNEINTVPGSLGYYLFSETLGGFTKMLNKMISVAQVKFAKEGSISKNYDSGILTGLSPKGAKHL